MNFIEKYIMRVVAKHITKKLIENATEHELMFHFNCGRESKDQSGYKPLTPEGVMNRERLTASTSIWGVITAFTEYLGSKGYKDLMENGREYRERRRKEIECE